MPEDTTLFMASRPQCTSIISMLSNHAMLLPRVRLSPVMWTPGLRHSAARKKCKKTQSKINVRLLAGTGGFWTGQAIPVSDFLCSGSRLSLGIGVEEPPAGARGITTGECYAAWSCHRAWPLVAVVERTSSVRLAVIKEDFEIPCATACS
jgi:hypothetical protein